SYALPHHVVRLDALFLADLPAYVVAASRLSGGLSSLEKAGEIYFYRQLDGTANRELSGELGNQVGRQGFEGLSLRNADESILEGGFRALISAQAHLRGRGLRCFLPDQLGMAGARGSLPRWARLGCDGIRGRRRVIQLSRSANVENDAPVHRHARAPRDEGVSRLAGPR